MSVSLRPVTRENVRAVCDLRVVESQRDLVAPAAFTVAEAHYEPAAVLRAVHLDAVPVGVLLVEVDSGTPHLVRFMVHEPHQRQGIGRRAVDILAEELGSGGWETLETSFVPVARGAERFWRACGFTDTGRVADREPVFIRTLRRPDDVRA